MFDLLAQFSEAFILPLIAGLLMAVVLSMFRPRVKRKGCADKGFTGDLTQRR